MTTEYPAEKPPGWFWVVSIVALVWNLMGFTQFYEQVTRTVEQINAMPPAMKLLYSNASVWTNSVFAIAVIFGTIGSISFLLRKAYALKLFKISLGATLIQMFHAFFMTNTFEVLGTGAAILSIMVIVISGFMVLLAKEGITHGWLE